MKIKNMFTQRLFRLDLQSRLALGFLIATCLTGVFATIVSMWTINQNTIAEVQYRVRQDINTAKLIYNYKLEQIKSIIQFTAEGSDLQDLISRHDIYSMSYMRAQIRKGVGPDSSNGHLILDMLTLVDARGKVLYRAANQKVTGDSLRNDAVVRKCMENKIPVTSTELMSIKNILRENPTLSD